jgi:type IV pilus assembly protein PilX
MTLPVKPYTLHRSRHRQKGMISTLIALIVLVVSLLAAMALMRSVDTSNTVAGSLTFRQAVLQEAERAYVDAQQKITFAQPTSDTDNATLGYYAEPQPATARSAGDIPNVLVNGTTGSIATVTALSTNDNAVTYVVERLCPAAGAASATTCIVPGASLLGGSSSNQSSDNLTPFDNGAYAAFRLTVRVNGPKGTVAYVQTIMR